MVDIKCKILPSSEGHSVINMTGATESARAFGGSGDTNYVCGYCGQILADNMNVGQIKNICVICQKCGNPNLIE